MKEINPNNIKKAEIVIGIPSFNEADSIAFVVKQVDRGLVKYFGSKSAVIINADNNSPDNTGKVFLETETKTPKIYISTPPDIRGKGNNLHNLFQKIRELEAKAGMAVDADLKSITPEWVKCFIGSIYDGYDFLSPIYHRHKYDASITNHLCYPSVYGLLGYNIRQPIGGDMGFSDKTVDYWLNQEWEETVRNYGIDIFMTLNAIKFGGKLGQVDLGAKIHKPSAPKLGPMFLAVAGTLFSFLSKNKDLWQKEIEIEKPPLVCKIENEAQSQELTLDDKQIEENSISEFQACYQNIKPLISQEIRVLLEKMFLEEKSLKIDAYLWPKIVYEILYIYQTNPENREEIIKFLRALYFGRVSSFVREVADRTQQEAEEIIQTQAQNFFEARKSLLTRQ
jgi:glycosyltransferase involved in cell wall biosynthesis